MTSYIPGINDFRILSDGEQTFFIFGDQIYFFERALITSASMHTDVHSLGGNKKYATGLRQMSMDLSFVGSGKVEIIEKLPPDMMFGKYSILELLKIVNKRVSKRNI